MISDTYRVMQYNVLRQKAGWTLRTELFEFPFKERAKNVAKAISDISPDIVLLSERHDEWAGIDTRAVAMEDGPVELAELLGGKYAIAQDRITHNGFTAVNRVPIAYNVNRLRLVDSGFIALTEEYPFDRSENKRTATWAIFEDSGDSSSKGQRFAAFNTHWSIMEHKGNSYAAIRAQQSAEMQTLINDTRFQDMPRIVGGDFNALYNFDIMQALLENCGLTHADMEINGKITWNSVDHIAIAGANISSYSRRRVDNASDHPPIYVDFTINNKNRTGGFQK